MKKKNTKTQETQAPSVFDTTAFRESLMQHVRERGGTAAVGGEDFLQSLVRSAMEALLEVEMEEHLGYAKHSSEGRGSGNSRNGKGRKRVRGDFGQMELSTPRDREGSFEPQLVKKRQSSLGNFGEKIVSLYARGMSTREIEDHLKELYGVEVSPQFISRTTEALLEEITDWQNRPLEQLYPIVYIDGMRAPVRAGDNRGAVLKKCLYTVLGVTVAGRQEVLGLWVADTEGSRFWLKVLNDLKARGLQDILIVCGDGLTGLPDAVESVFPQADVQLCVVHQIRAATRFVSYKERKAFCRDMREIYSSPTVEGAEQAFARFKENWEAKYPMSIASWERNWERLTVFYKYPVEIRKIVYTTNAIESLHAQIRKNTRNRKVFPNNEALIKLVFLNVRNFSKRWTKRQGWDTVMNQLSIIFKDRLSAEVLDEL